MLLTDRTEFALRLLMLLAVQPAQAEVVVVATAAEQLGVSANHLAKVAQDLVRIGAVETSRGRAGGLRLVEATRTRPLGSIVRALESVVLAECFTPSGACVLAPACRLAGVLQQASDAFFAALDGHSLTDLVSRPARIRQLLALA